MESAVLVVVVRVQVALKVQDCPTLGDDEGGYAAWGQRSLGARDRCSCSGLTDPGGCGRQELLFDRGGFVSRSRVTTPWLAPTPMLHMAHTTTQVLTFQLGSLAIPVRQCG